MTEKPKPKPKTCKGKCKIVPYLVTLEKCKVCGRIFN